MVGDSDDGASAGAPAAEAITDPLDRFARIAAVALRASIAVVTVRDGVRDVLAGAAGLPREAAVLRGEPLEDALVAAATAATAPLAIADLHAAPRLRDGPLVATAGAVAALAVALRGQGGAAIGALCVLDRRPRAWGDAERGLLLDLAAAAAHERERRDEVLAQAALRHVATAVAHGAEPEAVCAMVAEAAARAFAAESGAVVRYEDEHSARVLGTWPADGTERLAEDAVLAVGGNGIAARVRRGAAVRVDGLPGHRPFRNRIGAPIRRGGDVWGFVTALSNRGPLPPGAELRLKPFAELVAAAIGNAETRAALAAQATSDPLTGLANQRAFRRRLAAEAERARRHRRNLGLALFDVDGFKLVNDTYGHQVGDDVLSEVARRAAATIRAGDLLARLGGDELALLLPEADAEEAYAAAERVRQLVGHDPIGPLPTVTVSVGVSDLASAGGDAEGLLRAADDALYWAKAQGRNTVARYLPELVDQLGPEQRAERVGRGQALLGIGALARAVDAKDPHSQRHSERVAELAVKLARAAGWPVQRLALLREAALVHDVGKIGLPDKLLLARERSPAESLQLAGHAQLGAEIAAEVLSAEQVTWIRSHHERPDGGGYPDALRGDAIPHGARLITVADAWDAMTTASARRPVPLTPEQALEECRRGAGTQFATEAVAALERVLAAGELAPAWTVTPAVSLGA